MTAFLIGYPGIAFLASTVSVVGATEDSTLPVKNVVTGPRQQGFTINAVAGITDVKFDLGAAVTAGINFGFIARAKVLKAQGATTALFRSSSDDVTYSNRLGANGTAQSKTYTGPRSEDLFFASGFNDDIAGVPSSAFRYWRAQIGAASPTRKWFCSKIWMGTLFDFGSEPRVKDFRLEVKSRDPKNREPYMAGTLVWKGITKTIRNSFITNVTRYRDVSPVVFYDSGNAVFNGAKTLHASIIDVRMPDRTAAISDIEIDFEEQT